MDIRAINFVATVIGWCVLVLAVLTALVFGISEIQANTSDATRGVLLATFWAVLIIGGLYVAALDWLRERDKNERYAQQCQRDHEDRYRREAGRLRDELFRTQQALNAVTAKPKPKEQPRARTKPTA